MTETETEAGAETRQDMTRQGKTRQDDFAAYADAAARCCKNILGLRSINQATQMTEERSVCLCACIFMRLDILPPITMWFPNVVSVLI